MGLRLVFFPFLLHFIYHFFFLTFSLLQSPSKPRRRASKLVKTRSSANGVERGPRTDTGGAEKGGFLIKLKEDDFGDLCHEYSFVFETTVLKKRRYVSLMHHFKVTHAPIMLTLLFLHSLRLLSLDDNDSYEKIEEKYFQKRLTSLLERTFAERKGEEIKEEGGRVGGGTIPFIYEGFSDVSEEVLAKYGTFPVKFQVGVVGVV